VGDFMGVIEGLFQAIKVEMKQFSEFENWLEQGKDIFLFVKAPSYSRSAFRRKLTVQHLCHK
jgi:phosphoenolpyruvate carboxylase